MRKIGLLSNFHTVQSCGLRPLNSYKSIILDFDGVILNSEKAQFIAWQRTLNDFGINPINVDISNLIGYVDENVIDLAVPEKYSEFKKEILETKIKKLEQMQATGEIDLVKGVENFIRKHSQSHLLAIASSSDFERLNYLLSKYGLVKYFYTIVAAKGKLPVKPDPAVYNEVLHKIQMHTSECIVIEDSIIGIKAARTAGIYTVGITTSVTKQDLSYYANEVIDEFDELN